MTEIGQHKRVWEYDGAFKCLDCESQWGALPGHPTMPEDCTPAPEREGLTPDRITALRAFAESTEEHGIRGSGSIAVPRKDVIALCGQALRTTQLEAALREILLAVHQQFMEHEPESSRGIENRPPPSRRDEMSDTPRTNALLLEVNEGRTYDTVGPLADFARTLERELAQARSELEYWRNRHTDSHAAHTTTRTRAEAAERERDELIERCAQRCEAEYSDPNWHPLMQNAAICCAAAIRALKETP